MCRLLVGAQVFGGQQAAVGVKGRAQPGQKALSEIDAHSLPLTQIGNAPIENDGRSAGEVLIVVSVLEAHA